MKLITLQNHILSYSSDKKMKAIILLGTLKKNSLSNTEVLSDFKKKNIASSIIKKTTVKPPKKWLIR